MAVINGLTQGFGVGVGSWSRESGVRAFLVETGVGVGVGKRCLAGVGVRVGVGKVVTDWSRSHHQIHHNYPPEGLHLSATCH